MAFSGCQPSGPKSLLLGSKYLREGDYPRALKHLLRASELLPGHPQVWNYLGLAYHWTHQPQKAAEAYDRALKIDPKLPAAHFNLGVLLLEHGKINEAIGELSTFVALQPDHEPGLSKLGTALVRIRRTEEAERALAQALRLDPKDAEAHNSMGLVHVQHKRPYEAMLEFNAALEDRPGYPAALLNQAIVAQQFFAKPDLAIERYRAFLKASKDGPMHVEINQIIDYLEEASRPKVAEPPPTLAATNRPPPVSRPETLTATEPKSAAVTNAPPPETAKMTNLANAQPAKTNTPAPPPMTNLVARMTNSPPATPAPKTNLLAQETAPETSATNPPPVAESVPPVEVVNIGSEPSVRTPSDTAAPKEMQLAAARPAPNDEPETEELPLIPPRKPRSEESRPGFFERANPLRWFRSNDNEPKAPPSRPATSAYIPPESDPRKDLEPPEPEPPAAPRPKPEFARYPFRDPKTALAPGNRTEAEKYFVQGARAHQERRLAAAVESYRRAVAADPSYFDAQYNLGLAALRMKDLPLALVANEAAARLKPDSIDARYNFAITLRDSNYFVDAANELKELLELAPNEARAHLALANIYAQQLDEPALARKHYQRLLALAPNHPEAPAIRQWLTSRR